MQRGDPTNDYYRRGQRGQTGDTGDTGARGQRGASGNVRPWHVNVALGAIIITLIGGSLSLGQSVGSIGDKLDRNCRILSTINADVRFLIVEHSQLESKKLADQFRQIFQSAGQERC